uniref:Uncharacterized protein n=1 Tax=Xenopus tropicalis TaxID=8364 RepID=A0A803JXG3_XENTR
PIGPVGQHRAEKIPICQSITIPEEDILQVSAKETDIIKSNLRIATTKILLYRIVWFSFSFKEVFLNRLILSLLGPNPKMKSKSYQEILLEVCSCPGV